MNKRAISGLERILLRVGATMGADLIIGRVQGAADFHAFTRAAQAVVKRHPTLRLYAEGTPPKHFVYLPANTALADVTELIASESEPSLWQNEAIAQTARPFRLNGEPVCRFVLVRGTVQHHVIIAAPHALVDGRCLLRLLEDLMTAWGAEVQGKTPSWSELPITPAAITLQRYPWYFKALAPLLRKVWIADIKKYHQNPPLPPKAPARSDSDIATLAEFREGTEEGWKRLSAACKERNITVGAALLAATWFSAAKLIYEAKGAPPAEMVMDLDVDLRSKVKPAVGDTNVGYYTGFAPMGGKVAPDTDFWALAVRFKKETNRLLRWGITGLVHLLAEPVPDYFEFLEERGINRLETGGTGSLLAVSNVGKFPYKGEYDSLRLTGLWGLNGASVVGSALISWLRFLDGKLFYNVIGTAPAIDAPQLERFQNAIFQLLEHPPERLSVKEFCAR